MRRKRTTNYGEWMLPDSVPTTPVKRDGSPDRRWRISRQVDAYCREQDELFKSLFNLGKEDCFRPAEWAEAAARE